MALMGRYDDQYSNPRDCQLPTIPEYLRNYYNGPQTYLDNAKSNLLDQDNGNNCVIHTMEVLSS